MANNHIPPSKNYLLKTLPRSTYYWVLSTTLQDCSQCVSWLELKSEEKRWGQLYIQETIVFHSSVLNWGSRKARAPVLDTAFCFKMSTHETKLLSKPSSQHIQVDSFWQSNSTSLFISLCHADLLFFPGPMQGQDVSLTFGIIYCPETACQYLHSVDLIRQHCC